jgi:hypothetical protein
MSYFKTYIILVFLVKIIFICLAITNLYLKRNHMASSDLGLTIQFWKYRVEFIFTFLMSLLLIYIFNPTANKIYKINYETMLLFFLFGIILLITSNWNSFITEAVWFQEFKQIL